MTDKLYPDAYIEGLVMMRNGILPMLILDNEDQLRVFGYAPADEKAALSLIEPDIDERVRCVIGAAVHTHEQLSEED